MVTRLNLIDMGQISVKLADDRIDELDREAETNGFASRADLVREAIDSRNESSEDERELQETVDDLRSQLDDLRRENDRLRRERRQILEQRNENQQLVRFAEQQRTVLERKEERRSKPLWSRAFRFVFGGKVT
jgi:Arc/MetJ-type ribon-helix-helix transcriptional regulator